MNFIFAITHHTGIRLAELGFVLLAIAGVWLVASQVQMLKLGKASAGPGILIAAAGVLLVIATHWGHFS